MAEEVRFDETKREYWVREDGGEWDVIPEAAYGYNPLEAGLIGAGKTFTDFGRGISDLFGSETAQAEQAEADQLFAPLQEQQGLATGVGQALPYLATAPLGGAGIAGQAALAGGMGALRQTGGLMERAQTGGLEAAMGGAGAAAGNMAGRVVNRIRGVYTNKAAEQLIKQGGRLSPGQATGGMGKLEAMMKSGGMLQHVDDANQAVLQRNVQAALGTTGDLSEQGLGEAADQIGRRFDMALDGVEIPMTKGLSDGLERLKIDTEFLNMPDIGDTLSGEQYKQLRTQLGKLAQFEARNPSRAGKADVVDSVMSEFDGAFADAADPGQASMLRTAREQWRTLRAVEKGQAITPDGFVNARTLNNNLNRGYGTAGRRGKMDRFSEEAQSLKDISQTLSSKSMLPAVGNSGTAERLMMGLGLPSMVGLGVGAGTEDPTLGLMAALLARGGGGAYSRMGNVLGAQGSALLSGLGRGTGQGLMQ